MTLATYSGWFIEILLLEAIPEHRTATDGDSGFEQLNDSPYLPNIIHAAESSRYLGCLACQLEPRIDGAVHLYTWDRVFLSSPVASMSA